MSTTCCLSEKRILCVKALLVLTLAYIPMSIQQSARLCVLASPFFGGSDILVLCLMWGLCRQLDETARVRLRFHHQGGGGQYNLNWRLSTDVPLLLSHIRLSCQLIACRATRVPKVLLLLGFLLMPPSGNRTVRVLKKKKLGLAVSV